MRKTFRVVFIGLVGLIAAFILFAYIFQRSYVFMPPSGYQTPAEAGVGTFKEIPLRSEAGDALLGWWSAPIDEQVPVVLYFHGNGSALYSDPDIYRDIVSTGAGLLVVGYPGYPGSDGAPSQKGFVSSARAHYDFIGGQNIAPERIIYMGTSIGTGVAAQLSRIHPPQRLILNAPFYSVEDVAAILLPRLLVDHHMKDPFYSYAALEGVDVPLIWIHGTADKVVPLTEGQRLFDVYSGPKTAHILDGAGHNNLWPNGGREIVLEALKSNHKSAPQE